MNRTIRIALGALLAAALVAGVAGCAAPTAPEKPEAGKPAADVAPAKLRIGTLPTEDSLPLWVAERDGLFAKAGLTVEIVSFPSAQERDAALTAGAIDAFMGDLVAASALRAGGVKVRVATIMLGATPAEGRFGIVAKPGSKVTSLAQLAGTPVGTSSGTIQEYVLDGLMLGAGVEPARIKKEEVKKVPVRFELLMNGKLAAAALPEPFLSLAEKSGAKLIADDTGADNLSQTVLVFSDSYLDTPAGAAAATKLLAVWDEAVAVINAAPESFRPLLVDKARLPKPLEASYRVNTYPTAQLPTADQVAAVLDWMKGAGLLEETVGYRDLVWEPAAE